MKSTFYWTIGSGETSSGKASGGMTGPTADSSGGGESEIDQQIPTYTNANTFITLKRLTDWLLTDWLTQTD